MNKRILPAVLAGLCVLWLSALHAQGPAPAVQISKIQVLPGALATRLVLETDGPLAVDRAYYPPETPRTLVLDVARAATTAVPALPSSGAGLVRDIQVEKAGADALRLLVRLSERVPARIVRESGRTVVELNGVQRGQTGYAIDAATQAELDRKAKGEILLSRVDTTAGAEAISVKAALTGAVVTQVFALENPPRLVVDLFDTLLAAKSDVWPIEDPRSTVQRVRVAQFQTAGPRPITRMVFDLKEPGLYALDSRADGLVVSFFPSGATAPAALVQPAPASVPAPVPAPVRTEPAPPKAEPKVERKAEAKEVPVTPLCPPQTAAGAPQTPVKPAAAAAPHQGQFKPKTIAGEEMKYSGDIISLKIKDSDLKDVVLEQLNLTFPAKPLCVPDCEGICAVCGVR